MEHSCERAIEIGLPAIAFTEHADWVTVHEGQHSVDIEGYLEAVERCRQRFKDLRILSGIELGEPHWFPHETDAVLSAGRLDRVLGSVHCVNVGGKPVDASQFRSLPRKEAKEAIGAYFRELLALVESNQRFEVLTHLDYPKRYWPEGIGPYREEDFEVELREILVASKKTGRVLEINTTRNDAGEQRFCPGRKALRWWYEVGGEAVSFGSDAHDPDKIAAGFDLATEIVQAAGFKPSPDPMAFWRR